MHQHHRVVLAAAALFATIQSASAADIPASHPESAEVTPSAEVKPSQAAEAPAAQPASPAPDLGTTTGSAPAATVFDNREVSGILGREVRSAADENMGRVIDVIVDQTGHTRAAIIDFGGFLGVGSRKIAVDWNALHFPAGQKQGPIVLELTRDQVKAAPEYQEGKPIVVLGSLRSFDHIGLSTPAAPEK
jgi:hypothetical protein